jgi:hypothetical protein
VLGFTPVPFFAMLAFWVPWDRMWRWARRRLDRRKSLVELDLRPGSGIPETVSEFCMEGEAR